MKACFITFGCRLNRAEALDEEAAYLVRGWELTEHHSEADVFIVRGCSVTARAQRDCEKLVAHLRRKYPTKRLTVCGCLKPTTGEIGVQADRPVRKTAKPVPVDSDVPVPTRTARAYLKVQNGCSGKCAFCVVPQFRGPSVSVPFDAVLDKAQRFIDAGYHEIVVTGCNLALYASVGQRLPDLVATLAALSPDCRIRLGSVEPGVCALETVEAMAEHANVCRSLHLPIQSGSNMTLSAMRRSYLVRDVESVVSRAVRLMPRLGLGCDLIAGFPGESEMDFVATKGLIERLPFNNAHVFPYSERPNTPAANRMDVIPKNIRSLRAHALADIVRKKRHSFAKSFIGHEVEIVVEDGEKLAGWTSEYLWVESHVKSGETTRVPRKSLLRVKIANANSKRLIAR